MSLFSIPLHSLPAHFLSFYLLIIHLSPSLFSHPPLPPSLPLILPVPSSAIELAMPGSIRRTAHFLSFLRRFLFFLDGRMKENKNFRESPAYFLFRLAEDAAISDKRPLAALNDRLSALFSSLHVAHSIEYEALYRVCRFAGLIAKYNDGFTVVLEGIGKEREGEEDGMGRGEYLGGGGGAAVGQLQFGGVLRMVCHDPRVVFGPISEAADTCIITSGTLHPLEFYPKLLGFRPALIENYTMSLSRRCILPLVCSLLSSAFHLFHSFIFSSLLCFLSLFFLFPLFSLLLSFHPTLLHPLQIITRGADQSDMTTKFATRGEPSIVRNFGNLLLEIARIVPDGVVCFFPSYQVCFSFLSSFTYSLFVILYSSLFNDDYTYLSTWVIL